MQGETQFLEPNLVPPGDHLKLRAGRKRKGLRVDRSWWRSARELVAAAGQSRSTKRFSMKSFCQVTCTLPEDLQLHGDYHYTRNQGEMQDIEGNIGRDPVT